MCQYQFFTGSPEQCLKLFSGQWFASYNVPKTGNSKENQESRISKIFEVGPINIFLYEKGPFSTFKSLQGGHVDLADTPVVFLWGLW
jgi:hypothetical protein